MRRVLFFGSSVSLCLAVSALTACQSSPAPSAPEAASSAPTAATPTPAAPASAAPATQAATAQPYTVRIVAGDAKAGQAGKSVVEVTPAAGFHMNLEFPVRLRVTPPTGLTLGKADLSKEDAELTEAALRFSVPFTATAAGKVSLEALGDFSVCNDTTCKLIRDEKLAWDVDVKI
jgi:hypothetical protein